MLFINSADNIHGISTGTEEIINYEIRLHGSDIHVTYVKNINDSTETYYFKNQQCRLVCKAQEGKFALPYFKSFGDFYPMYIDDNMDVSLSFHYTEYSAQELDSVIDKLQKTSKAMKWISSVLDEVRKTVITG